jgi:hypothetical protein
VKKEGRKDAEVGCRGRMLIKGGVSRRRKEGRKGKGKGKGLGKRKGKRKGKGRKEGS